VVAAQRFAQFDTVQGCHDLSGGYAVPQGRLDAHDLAGDAGRYVGDPVGVGFNLAGGADGARQPLLFGRSDNHAVLLLHLGGHLYHARFVMFVMPFVALFLALVFLAFLMAGGLFRPVAGFLVFRMFRLAAFVLASAIVEAATQGYGQDKSDDDCSFIHCTPPLSSVATADSSFTSAVWRSCSAVRYPSLTSKNFFCSCMTERMPTSPRR